MRTITLTGETSYAALTAVSHTLARINVTTPGGDDLRTVIEGTDAARDFQSRFDLEPALELLARLDEIQKLDHGPRILEIVDELGTREVWNVLAHPEVYTPRYGAFWEPDHLLGVMMTRGLLPRDASVFVDGAAHPQLIETVLRDLRLEAEDHDVLVDFCLSRNWEISKLLHTLAHHAGVRGLTEQQVDKIVGWVDTRIAAGVEFSVSDRNTLVLSVEETRRVLIKGTRGALIVASTIGWAHANDLADLLRSTPAGRAIALQSKPLNLEGGVDISMLNREAASNLLKSQAIDDTDTLIRVLKLAGEDRKWILGKIRANQPTPELVLEALRVELLTVSDLTYVLAFTRGASWHTALADVPGLAGRYLRGLVERGTTINTPSSDDAIRDEIILNVMAEHIGTDVELWQRFFTATEKSPFALETATLVEIIEEYRSRWAQARARVAGTRT